MFQIHSHLVEEERFAFDVAQDGSDHGISGGKTMDEGNSFRLQEFPDHLPVKVLNGLLEKDPGIPADSHRD